MNYVHSDPVYEFVLKGDHMTVRFAPDIHTMTYNSANPGVHTNEI